MPPRLGFVNVVDEHHSTSYLPHPTAVPKTMPLRRRATQSVTIVRSGKLRSKVSPGTNTTRNVLTSDQLVVTTKKIVIDL
jgi:hypothetical protein